MSKVVLDCSDIDRFIGKPLSPSPLREPIANNDIRRWVHAMHYPNLIHYDPVFAAASRWGRLSAPQSFAVAVDDGHGASPACVGRIPNSHLLFGGDEWWFYGPRVFGGDVLSEERFPYDYVVKETKFGGPTCFQRGDNHYYNQSGDRIATQRSTSIRYLAEVGRQNMAPGARDDPTWTRDELVALEERKFSWIQMLHDLGHRERWWDDVATGDVLPERVFGPHSIASFTTEWRAYIYTIWGTLDRRTDLDLAGLGFTDDMAGLENDPVMERINPELTDGAYVGPSRGHLFPEWARTIGMPRSYGYGASMGAWITDYLAGWAGEWGMVVHSNCVYRGPAYTGDITVITGSIVDKMIDEAGRALVEVDVTMANQLGATLATAKAKITLPTRLAQREKAVA